MSTHHYVATGILVLEQVTPIISALFGCYGIDADNPLDEGVYLARIPQNGPTWIEVFGKLTEHARKLSLVAPAADSRAVVRSLAEHFGARGNEELNFLLRSIEQLDSTADPEDLFTIAACCDDGHGLSAIEIGAAWCEAVPSAEQLGGHARYISRDVPIHRSSAGAALLGRELSNALSNGRVRDAAALVLDEFDDLLSSIYSPEARMAIEAHVGSELMERVSGAGRNNAPSRRH